MRLHKVAYASMYSQSVCGCTNRDVVQEHPQRYPGPEGGDHEWLVAQVPDVAEESANAGHTDGSEGRDKADQDLLWRVSV